MSESVPVLFELPETTITASTEYRLPAGKVVMLTMTGDGVWQFWDGDSLVSFTAGSGKNLTTDVPKSGRIQATVNSGSVIVSFVTRNG